MHVLQVTVPLLSRPGCLCSCLKFAVFLLLTALRLNCFVFVTQVCLPPPSWALWLETAFGFSQNINDSFNFAVSRSLMLQSCKEQRFPEISCFQLNKQLVTAQHSPNTQHTGSLQFNEWSSNTGTLKEAASGAAGRHRVQKQSERSVMIYKMCRHI